MFLIAGLGNPGDEYADHRHNVGFMAVDALAEAHRFAPFSSKHQGLCSKGRIDTDDVLLLKPMTFMNKSGQSVAEAARYYKIPNEQVIVIYDELDLAPGKVRVKLGGGSGGHNGIKDIDQHLGNDFMRVRVGIGHPGDKARVTGYVLHAFAKDEMPLFASVIQSMTRHIALLLDGDAERMMTNMARDLGDAKPVKDE